MKNDTRELQKIKKTVLATLKRHGVKKAGIFGSFARGEQTRKSDIDIVVQPPRGLGFGFAGIELELEAKLKKKVDLLTYRSIHPLLKKAILKDEVRIL